MGALAPAVGRWHVFVCEACGEPTGRHKDCEGAKRTATEVVPCDSAALERAARALCESDGSDWDTCDFKSFHREDIAKAFRAAGESE